jgi:hypothetical protein
MVSVAQAETPAERRLGIATNVLGVATLNPTVDVEVSLTRGWTVGATAWWEVREVQDRWGQVRIGFYPGGRPLVGLGLALTGGFHRAYGQDEAVAARKIQATSATAGLLVGYTWRFWDRMVLTPVLGAKATLSDNDDPSPLAPAYIEGRLNLGAVF